MTCNKDLQAAGKANPRTCVVCGRGKCTKYPEPALLAPGGVVFLVIRSDGSKAVGLTEERAHALADFASGVVEEVPIL